jgi:hypothetical protein
VTTRATFADLFPSHDQQEWHVLVLEFQRLTSRLAQVGLLSPRSSLRFVRELNRGHARAEDAGRALPALVGQILLSIEDGALLERRDYLRRDDDFVLLHLESVARALYRAERSVLTARDMRGLFSFGWQHFREVVPARSERAMFGPPEDRRRTVILNVAKAIEFVGGRSFAVPLR